MTRALLSTSCPQGLGGMAAVRVGQLLSSSPPWMRAGGCHPGCPEGSGPDKVLQGSDLSQGLSCPSGCWLEQPVLVWFLF